jgi:oligoendopeptidase F
MEIRQYSTADRKYLDAATDYSEIAALKKGANRLLAMPVCSLENLEKFLEAWQELDCALDEAHSRAYLAMTIDTNDKNANERWEYISEKLQPEYEELHDKIINHFLDSSALELLGKTWAVYTRKALAARRVFRKENIPLGVELTRLSTEYQKLGASWEIEVDGQMLKFVQLGPIFEGTDAAKRKQTWLDRAERLKQDRQRLTDLYREMVQKRSKIAEQADFANYRDYIWEVKVRDDYNADDCHRFADTVLKSVVPLATKIVERRATDLGLDNMKPWDIAAYATPPPQPFTDADQVSRAVEQALTDLDGELGTYFKFMRENNLLDLETRPGKTPGGYQTSLEVVRHPFIFMNFSGTIRDFETLLHEGGHATNYWLSRDFLSSSYRHPSLEFAEVASMSMELIGFGELHSHLPEEEYQRFWRRHLEEIVLFLPYMVMVDQFQHRIYTENPDDPQLIWDELAAKYQPYLDTSGIREEAGLRWLMQLHIFEVPFYYIEYGIAQLGALNVWLNTVKDHQQGVSAYRNALSLGGSVPLPELFAAANIPFSFEEDNVLPLMKAVADEIGL